MRKKGGSNFGTLLFILILIYGGYVAYQYGVNWITVKNLKTNIKEGLYRKLPIRDWDKAIEDVIIYHSRQEGVPESSLSWDYEFDNLGRLHLKVYYISEINYLFSVKQKEYVLEIMVDPRKGL